jgi:hypothetical protein
MLITKKFCHTVCCDLPRALRAIALALSRRALYATLPPEFVWGANNMVDPRAFKTEYVEPAVALWQKNHDVKHLAIHAITEVDVLAEVVALWTLLDGRPILPKCETHKVTKFRDELGAREPALAIVRDAHDSHKHGALHRVTAKVPEGASKGQRPETVTKASFFFGHSFYGGPPTLYEVLVFVLNDGTEKRVSIMLHEAMKAWDREFAERGL